jgi:hypothetical protein
MNIIEELIRNINKLEPPRAYSKSVTKEALDASSDLNRDQLENSTLTDGSSIGGYAKATESYNNSRRTKITAGQPIKFKDSGGFHRSIRSKISKEGDLTLYSTSKKAIFAQDYVDGKFSRGNANRSVLGLTIPNLHIWYNQLVHEQFKKNLLNKILYGV